MIKSTNDLSQNYTSLAKTWRTLDSDPVIIPYKVVNIQFICLQLHGIIIWSLSVSATISIRVESVLFRLAQRRSYHTKKIQDLLAFGFRFAVSFEIEPQEKHEVAEVEADSNGRVTVGIPAVVPIPLPVHTVEVNDQPHKHLQRLHRGYALG